MSTTTKLTLSFVALGLILLVVAAVLTGVFDALLFPDQAVDGLGVMMSPAICA